MNPSFSIPVIRLSDSDAAVAAALNEACHKFGFFLISDHGIPSELEAKLAKLSERFFAQVLSQKMEISMDRGGLAWRGFFPVGDELTSGKSDLKEGIYFGEELSLADPRVQKRIPLHGANLFPEIPGLREVVLEYIDFMKSLGDRLTRLISLSLELPAEYFQRNYTSEPTQLFRIFHYPPSKPESEAEFPWGVGEHTDYGLLTILKQDDVGGLEVKVDESWIPVSPIPGTLVCNVGDMLDYLTQGYYRSAPHRVRNSSGRERYSYPYFFDPGFSAPIEALPNLYQFQGTYGDYLLKKVSKVFPELATQNEIVK